MSNIDPKARTWAEIDMAALKHNFEIAKRTGKKVLCVIKANAYGHGAVHCGLFLEKQGADFFAVACLSEAGAPSGRHNKDHTHTGLYPRKVR